MVKGPILYLVETLLVCALVVPVHAVQAQAADRDTGEHAGTPLVVWRVSRAGFLPVRNAWMIGSDAMFRLTYDDGATWYGFKPIFADSQKGFLAVRAFQGKGAADGGQDWTEKAAVTVARGRPATVRMGDEPEFTIEILEFKTVAAGDLEQREAHGGAPEGGSSG